MKEQIEIIEAYLEVTFQRSRGEYDANITDESFFELWAQEQAYYHSLFHKSGYRDYTPDEEDEDIEDMDEYYLNEMNSYVKRPILIVAKHEKAILGDALKRVLKSEDSPIYIVDLGTDVNVELDSEDKFRVYWADTDEGFKIIYWKYYFDDEWDHSSNYEPMMVKDDGREVEKKVFHENVEKNKIS